MDLKQYQENALKTCVLKDRNFNLRHAGLGMMTEPAELLDAIKKQVIYGKSIDVVNVKEEIGDGLWYAAVLAKTMGFEMAVPETFDFDLPGDPDAELLISALCAVAGMLLGGMEIAIAENNDEFLVSDLPELFIVFVGLSDQIAKKFGFTIEDACDTNIAKLKKRYPHGFTEEAALNRDLDAERAVLEQH